ncbi:MAG: regulatory protein RecX [Pseudomonadota bacterium]
MALKFTASDPLSPNRCRKRAMDALARREHSRAELTQKLEKVGFAADTIATTLDRLADENLQNDDRFIEAFIASRWRQGKGPVRIRAELSNRGVTRTAIDAQLAICDKDWFALASEVRARKFGDALAPDYQTRAKQMRFLSGRGFSAEQVRAACGD